MPMVAKIARPIKPIIVVDFDGVLHGYQSGWKGASVIPDPPVPGALQFLVESLEFFQVNILSSRSHQWGGRRAMKAWLRRHLFYLGTSHDPAPIPDWWRDRIHKTAFADPWDDEVRHAADLVVKEIRWPWFKPPALVTLDDRAMTFTGTFPHANDLYQFRPWNKK